jgi:hypothetical protein
MGDIYNKELNGTNEIYEEILRVAESGKENFGNKITLVRMFVMAKEQDELNRKKELIEETISERSRRTIVDISFVDDNSGIIQFKDDTFKDGHTDWYSIFIDGKIINNLWAQRDAAEVFLLCKKHGESEETTRIICKILGFNVADY